MHRFRFTGAIRATLLAAALTSLGFTAATQAATAEKTRVIVAFKAGAGAAARAAINGAGGRVVTDLSEVNAVAVELSPAAVAALRRHASVEFIESDPIQRVAGYAAPKPRAKRGVSTSLLPGTPEQVPYGIPMVQANQVSDLYAGVRKVCIVDSGIQLDHEDFAGINADGVNLTASGEWFTDENSHGTHVAGTIAAVDNTVGVVGVMPHHRINLYIAKVFDAAGSAPSSVIAKAMLKCMVARSNVVSMSLGGAQASRIQQRVADLLEARGILMIAAAGNAGTADGPDAVEFPAGFANVVSVAAIDESKLVASFSQKNTDVELAAPGVAVLSTVPIGSQIAATVDVNGTLFPAIPMEGSPLASANGPLADFGFGDTPVAGSMAGKVCLISRGNISFGDKVLNCQNSGGVAAIVYNNTAGDLNGTLGDIVTTIPSVGTTQADGLTMLATKLGQPTTVSVATTQDAYAFYNGTSMATPHVSAVAALVWSFMPSCTAAQIRTSLGLHAMDLGDPGRDIKYGFGLVQAKATVDAIKTMGCGL